MSDRVLSSVLAVMALVHSGCVGELRHTGGDRPPDPPVPESDGGGALDAGAPAPSWGPADGLSIVSVSLLQPVEIPLLVDGVETSTDLPIIAERPTMIQIGVAPTGAWSPALVRATVVVSDGATETELTQEKTIAGRSDVASADSLFRIVLEPRDFPANASILVRLTSEAGDPEAAPVAWPSSGSHATRAQRSAPFTVELVRVHHQPSGALGLPPEVTAAQLERARELLLSWMPISESALDVRVRPFPISTYADVSDADAGYDFFSRVLDEVNSLWLEENPSPNTIFFGLLTFDTSRFPCETCFSGLGNLSDRTYTGPQSLAAVGMWTALDPTPLGRDEAEAYAEAYGLPADAWELMTDSDLDVTIDTLSHEAGHNLSLDHAPCGGAKNADPSYPEADGKLDRLAYDHAHGRVRVPALNHDFMSYCSPEFVSAHNYRNVIAMLDMLERVSTTGGAAGARRAAHRFATLRPDRAPYLHARTVAIEPLARTNGPETLVRALAANGRVIDISAARLYPHSERGGAGLFFRVVDGAVRYETDWLGERRVIDVAPPPN
jgi:hypothetical protein